MVDYQHAPLWVPNAFAAHCLKCFDSKWRGRIRGHGLIDFSYHQFILVDVSAGMGGDYFFSDGLSHIIAV